MMLSDAEFTDIAQFIHREFGIHLSDHKKALVAGRLGKRVRQLGLSSFSSYLRAVQQDDSGEELTELVNRITTNHSYFFREKAHFDFLEREVFPALAQDLRRRRNNPVRVWSAGCAAGEEVYTLAMLFREYFGPSLEDMDLGLLATDLSLQALAAARAGVYPANRLQEIPARYTEAYFRRLDADSFEVSDTIRKMVLFKKLNLMDQDFPFKGAFDIIFCRNVMIYFNEETRRRLVDNLYRYTRPGGYLFIGHSESLRRESCPFRYIRPAVYHKPLEVRA